MSYEIDSVKREINTLKYDLTRKVENEDFRRKINDLEQRIKSVESHLKSDIDETNRRIDYIREQLNLD